MRFDSGEYRSLDLLPEHPGRDAAAVLSGGGQTVRMGAFCHLVRFSLTPHTTYELFLEGCEPGFCYLGMGEELCPEGIRVLTPETGVSPYRERVHFTPPCGWLNDPNGLCYHGGWYHLYYQFYPHAQHWGNMHWGHAISRDLVHWVHQPVFLTPQQVLLGDETRVGGAFSGSAVADGKGIRFFFTRHTAPKDDEPAMEEIQVTAYSENGIVCGPETVVVENDRPEFSCHFRDPKVFRTGEDWRMVLGSCVDGVPAILLYRSEDGLHWTYAHPLLTTDAAGCESIECPDCFPLGEQFVAIGALMNRVDACGRKSPLWYYAGGFQDDRLTVKSEGLFDFGGSLYALQTFEHAGRRVAIGWVADFYNEHQQVQGGVCGSMSLPRELFWKGNRLWMRPVEEVYRLVGEPMAEMQCNEFPLTEVPGGAYYAYFTLPEGTDFTATIATDGEESLQLVGENGVVCLRSSRTPQACFQADCGPVHTVEIFFDHRTAELFLNNGESAAVKTFYAKKAAFGLSASSAQLGLHTLKR